MIPSRGLILVEPVETEEVLPGGRILLVADTRERMTANQCEVVAVGEPAECDPTRSRAERKCKRPHYRVHDYDGDTRVHPCTVHTGDWIIVRPRAYVASGVEKRWFVKQDDVLAILNED